MLGVLQSAYPFYTHSLPTIEGRPKHKRKNAQCTISIVQNREHHRVLAADHL